ncbi:hypothetical protein BHM03_00007014 [Ensete ventricosum]|nr:hypothetical protein BHM03_00007014 [Ensete ventricosum]
MGKLTGGGCVSSKRRNLYVKRRPRILTHLRKRTRKPPTRGRRNRGRTEKKDKGEHQRTTNEQVRSSQMGKAGDTPLTRSPKRRKKTGMAEPCTTAPTLPAAISRQSHRSAKVNSSWNAALCSCLFFSPPSPAAAAVFPSPPSAIAVPTPPLLFRSDVAPSLMP